jgi:hypothetical protein
VPCIDQSRFRGESHILIPTGSREIRDGHEIPRDPMREHAVSGRGHGVHLNPC